MGHLSQATNGMMNQRFAIVLVAVGIVTSFAVAQHRHDPGEKTLAELLQEREETLSEITESIREAYGLGEASLDSLLAAENALVDGQLDSATTTQERIAIRETQLRRAMQLEDDVRTRVEVGGAAPFELQAAKVNRLNAQIALLREQETER